MQNEITALNFRKELTILECLHVLVILNNAIISLSCQIDVFLRWSDTFTNDCKINFFLICNKVKLFFVAANR